MDERVRDAVEHERAVFPEEEVVPDERDRDHAQDERDDEGRVAFSDQWDRRPSGDGSLSD